MDWKRFQLHSLKTRVTLLTLTIFLVSVWSLAFYASRTLRDDMQRQLGEQQLSTVALIAGQIDQELDERLRTLEKIAAQITPSMVVNPPELQAFLDQRLSFQSQFNAGFFVTDADGTAIADLPRSVGRVGTNYLDRSSVALPLETGQSMIGRPALGKKLQAPIFSMTAPIRDRQGRVVGALVGTINLGQSSFLDKITQNGYGQTGGYLLIAPQHQLVVTASDKNRVMQPVPAPGINRMHDRYMQGYQGYGVSVNSRGIEELSAARAIPVAGWVIVSVLPSGEAFAPIDAMQRRLLLATALLTLLAGALTWSIMAWMLRRQLLPVLAATRVLAVQSTVEPAASVLPAASQDELGELIGSLNRLLGSSGKREAALQESESRFRALADNGSAMIWMAGLDRQCNYFNKIWLEFTGRSSAEEMGEGWVAGVHPDDVQRCVATYVAAFDARRAFTMEYRLRRHDGEYRWLTDHGVPRHGANGAFIGYIGSCLDISDRILAEAALVRREALLKQILDSSNAAIFVLDEQGRITQANQRMGEMFGSSPESLVGSDYVLLLPPSDREKGGQRVFAALSSAYAPVDVDRLFWRADHSQFWGHLSCRGFDGAASAEQGPDGLVGVIVDIGWRRRSEEKLHLAASVFTHSREAITITAADGTIIDVNEAFSRITGYSRDQVLGENPRVLKSGRQNASFYAAMWDQLAARGHWSGEIWNRRKNGEVYPEILTISAVSDGQGVVQHYVALFSDISALKAQQSQLERIAHFDQLTGLPNRVLLADRLRQAMALALRHGQRLAVTFLDLDGFKSVNDQHGHEVGDQLLMVLAGRMKQGLRDADTLARLGGDEFVAVLLELPDAAACVTMMNRLLAAAAQPVHVGLLTLQVSASLGVTFYPQADEVDADQLLRQADQAMYQAKLAGKNRYHVFDAEQDRSIRGHHEGLGRIRSALLADEFVLHYQPKVNMRTGMLIGAEALIRWQHPEKGLLLPAEFLPLIETHTLAIEVGEWVIKSALGQIECWREAGFDVPVSVNVGARQLQQPDFVPRLRQLLAEHPGVAPGSLELEVLETSALDDLTGVSRIIEDCRAVGVRRALDDFGTGYSSLTYLKRLSVAQLKIDQSFVRNMLDDPDDLAILEGILGLATAFGREVIAEGVETVEHGEMLLQLGCDLAQGYGIARAMPAAELPSWAALWRPAPAWLNLASVSRDDLPLLSASADHRAWVEAIEAFLASERGAPPLLDHRHCRFGNWLQAEGLARHGQQAAFQIIERVHGEVHALAAELCELHGQGGAALARLGELHRLRDTLHEELRRWCRGGRGRARALPVSKAVAWKERHVARSTRGPKGLARRARKPGEELH